MRTLNLTEEQYNRVLWGLTVAANTYYDRRYVTLAEKFDNLENELRETYGEPIDD